MSVAQENDGNPLAVGGTFRRSGSIHQSRTRLSSESINNVPTSTTLSSRPSIDKSRTVKMLYNKVSQDFINGSDPGHRKMDSFASANTKQSLASKGDRSPISPTFSVCHFPSLPSRSPSLILSFSPKEDTRSQEFDDMMRSGSTMKVSLTPDRLRTMEVRTLCPPYYCDFVSTPSAHQVLNKEKARANGRQKAPLKAEKSNGIDTPPSHSSPEQAKRTSEATPTIRRVGSVVGSEDDRLTQKPPPTSRPRQLSAATASGYTASSFSRVRATSTTTDPSTALSNMFLNKHALSESNSALSDQRPASGSMPRRKSPPQELDLDASRSSRTRTVARNRESLDLEDIMAGSDDDGMGELKAFGSPKQHDRQRGFSTSTKELIAFLAEGPPELTLSENSLSPLSTTPKKSGRLQKMISRITLASDTVKPHRKMTIGPGDVSSKSMTNLSPLANRPVPPRYPTSGPPSAASSERGSADQSGTYPRQRAQSYAQKPLPTWDGKSMEGEAPAHANASLSPRMDEVPRKTSIPVPAISQSALEMDISQPVQPIKLPPSPTLFSPPATSVTVSVCVEATDATPTPAVQRPPPPPLVPQHMSSKTASPLHQKIAPPPASQVPSPVPSILEHAREMRMMLEHATSAAECRILVDMFLARSKLAGDAAYLRALAPPPPPPPRDSGASGLERAIVEMFLGDGELDVQREPSLNCRSVELAEAPPNTADTALSLSSTNRPAEPSESY